MDGYFSTENYYGLVDIGIYLCYAGMIIGGLLAILFPVWFFIKNPKGAKTSGIGLAIALLLFGISYMLSTGELNEKYIGLGVDTDTYSRVVGGSLILLYVTGIGAVVIAIGTEIAGIFKR
ncbi:MAG: hypothetical protein HYY40_10480 [Bacteroidetes bacterium]|nr:hypothetical protein [Bacteroidota bacterium]